LQVSPLKEGLLENTMIIFSSDNGPVLNDGYKDGAAEKVGEHKPAGGLRGGKYSLFDGGTHIPLFVYWKGTISPVISDALICQMDLIASLGKLVNASLPEGLDSREYLDAFMGKKLQARENLVVEAQGRMAYRQGDWMMIPPYRGQERNLTGNELGNLPEYALFNLKEDKAQQENRVAGNEPLLEEMKENFFTLTAGYYKSEVEEEPLK
jgi:arylsulfatase A-like enzyme